MTIRWPDLAEWVGPTENHGGALDGSKGLVLHIAQGYYGGTISWQRNPDAKVSSHFITGRRGQLGQMVDLDRIAWTQIEGNGTWHSIENEGFTPDHVLWRPGWERLTPEQVENVARVYARGHQAFGWPFELANNPDQRGLGYHAMDREWLGERWGHDACPGAAIIGQRGDILERARAIAGVPDSTTPPAPTPADSQTRRLLVALPTLRRGDNGRMVRKAQALLNTEGAQLREDGDFGPLTDAAVHRFQDRCRRRHGSWFLVDGIIGTRQTWPELMDQEAQR